MTNEWKRTTQTLNGIPCLTHRETGELTAFGVSGCLYQISDTELGAIKYLSNGDETLVSGIKAKQAKAWGTKLGVPASSKDQLSLTGGAA